MPTFTYRIKKPGGRAIEKGQFEAESIADAVKILKAQGNLILEVDERHPLSLSLAGLLKRQKVPLTEKIIFTRQLSVMVKAGLSVVKALEALKRQSENRYFQEVIDDLVKAVKGGKALSEAMARYPKVFAEVFVAVVRAGEQTGQMAETLMNLADQQEKEADLIAKVKGAMIYPMVIFGALIGVVILIVFFVLPSLETIFADFGGELPLVTRILFGFSNFLRQYFLIFIGFVIAFSYALKLLIRRREIRLVYDRFKLKIPVFGNLTKKVYMARFSRTMAMLTKASLPIIQSLSIVQKTITNSLYYEAFDRIQKEVESGRPLSQSLQREPLFPPMVSQLTSLGEESGNLEAVLLEIARFYDTEVDNLSKNLSALIEPLMLIVMGLGVGFVVLSVISPIYKLVNQF